MKGDYIMRKMYSKKQIENMTQEGLVGKDIKVKTIECFITK